MNPRLRKAALFVGIAFLLDWLLIGLFLALGGRVGSSAWMGMLVVYMFGPLTAAIIVQKVIYKEGVIQPLHVSFRLNRWFLVALLLPPLLSLAAFGVSLLFPGVTFSPPSPETMAPGQTLPPQLDILFHPAIFILIILVNALIAGATVNAVAAFGEELGWRGLLLRELRYLGFWRASAVIGIIWGLWHAPVILLGYNFPQHPRLGVLIMTLWTLLFSPLISYVTLRARSVIAAAVMHGTLNGSAGLSILLTTGGSDLTRGLGFPFIFVLVLANVLLFLYDRYISKDPLTGKRGDELDYA